MSGEQYSSWNLLVREAAEQFRQAGIDPADAENEARQIFSFVTGKDRTWLFLHGDEKVLHEDGKAPDGVQRFLNLARERAKRIPLAYVLGERDFFGRTFLVTPDVLIPEPETELLVEQVLQERSSRKNARNTSTSATEKLLSNEFTKVFQKEKAPAAQKSLRILDLCTGSGCIAITLAAELAAEATHGAEPAAEATHGVEPAAAAEAARGAKAEAKSTALEIVAADISEAALRVAAENAKKILGSDADLVRFVRSDLFAEIEGSFEIIVSNPPYIATEEIGDLAVEVAEYTPKLALDGGDDGLVIYRRIAEEAPQYLNEGGWLFLEIGYDQGESVPALLAGQGWRKISVIRDYSGLDRIVVAERP